MIDRGENVTHPPPLRDYPLGAEPTGSPHSVVCSFPTLADVHGYARRDPETMRAIEIGYPRFFRNPVLERLVQHYRNIGIAASESFCYPLHPGTVIRDLVPAGTPHTVLQPHFEGEHRCVLLELPKSTPEALRRVIEKRIRFHGSVLCSRLASRIVDGEAPITGEADPMLADLARATRVTPSDIRFSNSGMSAFHAAFRAIRDLQYPRARKRWLQLGWLYVDSGEILAELSNDDSDASLDIIWDINDRKAIEIWLDAHGDELAGVVVEVPNNPLLEVVDLPWLAEATQKKGGLLLVDPSTVSILNVQVIPWCDVMVTSLTKYTGWSGDLMLGLCGINPDSPQAGALRDQLNHHNLPASKESVARLQSLWPEAVAQTRKMTENAVRLADFLEDHPAVDRVWYPRKKRTAHKSSVFEKLSADTLVGGGGGMVTFTLNAPLADFYDRLGCFKGPSFGTYFTNISPFIHLAHFDLATTAHGRARLAEAGIPPELIRASIGAEPYPAIEAAFRRALDGCA